MVASILGWGIPALLTLGIACATPARPPQSDGSASFAFDEIDESSGLFKSRQHAGVFWTHNDSLDASRIFAVTATGELIREVAVAGAENVDWEAITGDDQGYLYVGDIGNNRNRRRDLVVYRVREPNPWQEDRTEVATKIPFAYPDQTGFPDRSRRNFDAEALFWARGHLYLLTKHRSDTQTTLYRFPHLSGGDSVPLVRIGSFDLGRSRNPPATVGGDHWLLSRAGGRFAGMATGAAATPDGSHLAVLSYHGLFLFAAPQEGHNYLSRLVRRIELDERVTRQCEAVAWDGEDLVFSNEDGTLFRVEGVLASEIETFPSAPEVDP